MKKEDRMDKLKSGSDTAKWAYRYIKKLEEYIEYQGANTDTCTYYPLGVICPNCQCPRSSDKGQV